MSANVDLVRSIYADWERGDFHRADWADPEIEFVVAEGPDQGSWRGLGGLAEARRVVSSHLEDHRLRPSEYCELDAERVFAVCQAGGRGKASGVDLAAMGGDSAHLFHVHGGRVTKLVLYFDRDSALADLGLKE
jgi:ketosteroid isomerase-like protein